MADTENHPDSYYLASAGEMPRWPAFSGERRADVCIVGGGYTGLNAAIDLAEKGFDVVLIEAKRIAWGCSGRNGGQVSANFKKLAPVEKALGREGVRRAYALTEESCALVHERCRTYGIDCEWTPGHFTAAMKQRQLRDLAGERDHMAATYGVDRLELVEGEATRERVDSPAYVGGLGDPQGGHIHPLKYARGLAQAAERAGATIHEDSAAVRIDPDRPAVHLASGSVEARHVLVCCNGYLEGLVPEMRSRIMPVGSYIAATEPLGEERAGRLIGRDEAIVDANNILNYYRLSRDRRLLFGGRVATSLFREPHLPTAMRSLTTRVFPQLSDIRFDYIWGGNVAVTVSRAPHLGRLGRHVYFAQGFSGHGVPLSGFSGRLMAEVVAGTAERFDLLARVPHRKFPGGELLRAPIHALALLWFRLQDALP